MVEQLFNTYQQFRQLLLRGSGLPHVMLFVGEESYFVDLFEGLLSDSSLDQEIPYERITLYGPEVEVHDVIQEARGMSMFSSKRLILVKEASQVKPTHIKGKTNVSIDNIAEHLHDLSADTFIAFFIKGKDLKAQARKKWEEVATYIVESPRIRKEKDIKMAIEQMAKLYQLQIGSECIRMILELVGNDLVTINTELSKLVIATKLSMGKVLPNMITELVSMSKEYSPYDLLRAVRNRDRKTALTLAQHMGDNEKRYPITMTNSVFYNFFSTLLVYQYNSKKSKYDLMDILKLHNEYQLEDYKKAALKYTPVQTVAIISALRKIDHAYKGVSGVATDSKALYLDLMNEIFYA